MSLRTPAILFTILLLFGCDDCDMPESYGFNEAYAIILVAGQSNTHAGLGLDPGLDRPVEAVRQLGRFCGSDREIIAAVEPLDHFTASDDRIGFALTFAKLFAEELLEPGRHVLIVPAGYGGTGFAGNHWNKGDELYEETVSRVRYLLERSPQSSISAILWHQGESDVGSAGYEEDLDRFISDLRTDLQATDVPFILGGMVPYWVAADNARKAQQAIIAGTPMRVQQTGYADPDLPFVISKPDDSFDEIHYDAAGMRELGRRYFEAYLLLN